MSVIQVRQSLTKAQMDLANLQRQLSCCYTPRQRYSLCNRIRQKQIRVQQLQIRLRQEMLMEQRRIAYKQQVANQRAQNAVYNTMRPRRGNGRRYY